MSVGARGACLARRRRWAWRLGSLLGAACLMGAALAVAGQALDRRERAPLAVEGVPLPPEGDPAPLVRAIAHQWLSTPVTLVAGAEVLQRSRRALGARVVLAPTVAEARARRGYGAFEERLLRFLAPPPRDLALHVDVDPERLHAAVGELVRAARLDAVPSDAGRPGHPGLRMRSFAALGALDRGLRDGDLVIALPVAPIDPPSEASRGPTALFDRVLGAYSTRYGRDPGRPERAMNLELAAAMLDTSLIAPGGELSFNRTVGERSPRRGFLWATELRGGRRVLGIGGGICQVAATLHAAAFLGAFEIVEHHPHTRGSSYIPQGLDAAVSWPRQDLRVRNPYPFPVRVRSSAYRGIVHVELRGRRRAPAVEWSTREIERIGRGTERLVDTNLPLGAQAVEDDGVDGRLLERTRIVRWPDGIRVETVRLRYPPVGRRVRVGPQGPP